MTQPGSPGLKKKGREALYRRELATILRFGALVSSSLTIETVLDNAMKWAEEFMDAEASSIYELDEVNNLLFIRLARGPKKEPVKGITLKPGEGVSGYVVQTGKAMVVHDVTQEKRFSDKFDRITGFKTRSMICVPLIVRNQPIGAIEVINKRSDKAFNRADLELLMSMAQLIAIAMENASLYQQMAEEIHSTTQELKVTQEKLIRTERLAAMGHLAQGLAHEIRNPVMTIGGFAQRIKNEVSEGKLLKYVEIIMEETARLESLVRQIHEFLNVQSASLREEGIASIIDEALRKIAPRADAQHVNIIRDVRVEGLVILLDSSQLLTAFHNLLENAVESMPNGGTLTFTAHEEEDGLLVTVKDTGCGIPKERLDSIYDPFVTSKTRGAGLGLTMVHQIIMNHKGEIRITSEANKGTTASIQVPLQRG
jgi:signal transduction histidine kinase